MDKAKIIENSGIDNTKGLGILLRDTVLSARDTISVDRAKEAEAFNQEIRGSIDLRIVKFLKGLDSLLNNVKKDKITETAVNLIKAVFEEVGYEIELEECFILFHMRNLGKFRLKEDKFFTDLEKIWSGTPYELSKVEYKRALRDLKNGELINLRRGCLTLCDTVIIRFD